MKIACLSGKGGAGKTLAAVNLAATAKGRAVYIDCDVEEPNGRLFLKPERVHAERIGVPLPEFDAEKCTGCKACVRFCRFHALTYIREKPMVFAEVCHSCGGCMLVCPQGAIDERSKEIGTIETGMRGRLKTVTGILDPGEASGVPLIKEALRRAEETTIIDCPPGSACSVMESVADADICLLIAEPTAFGFHNFKMVCELTELLGRKCGVIINKEEKSYPPLEEFCREKGLPILARIPYDAKIAALAAEGEIVSERDEGMRTLFEELWQRIGGAV